MGWVFGHPSLTALEVAWRWVFGIPMLMVCWVQAQKILAALPPDTAGIGNLSLQNPWLAAVQLDRAWSLYRPLVGHVLIWLAPAAGLAWAVVAGLGRSLVLKRLHPRLPMRPLALIALQAGWLLLLIAIVWDWYQAVGWVARTHIVPSAEPDLVGFSMWVIFLTLGYFTLWAVVSWVLTIAPLLALLEDRSAVSALGRSLWLGKAFTGKLIEANLVMGIVKLALMVVAMVFSSVLIPFADEVGMSALHQEWVVVAVFYFVAGDYFQVVRLKGFVEFWRTYRGIPNSSAAPAGSHRE
jgi:hypothetical protein